MSSLYDFLRLTIGEVQPGLVVHVAARALPAAGQPPERWAPAEVSSLHAAEEFLQGHADDCECFVRLGQFLPGLDDVYSKLRVVRFVTLDLALDRMPSDTHHERNAAAICLAIAVPRPHVRVTEARGFQVHVPLAPLGPVPIYSTAVDKMALERHAEAESDLERRALHVLGASIQPAFPYIPGQLVRAPIGRVLSIGQDNSSPRLEDGEHWSVPFWAFVEDDPAHGGPLGPTPSHRHCLAEEQHLGSPAPHEPVVESIENSFSGREHEAEEEE